MKRFLLTVSAVFCFAMLTACTTTEEKTVEKTTVSKKTKSKKKTKSQEAWYKEMLKRDRVRDHDVNQRIGDDFQVFPGRKGSRSSDLDGNFKAFFWE